MEIELESERGSVEKFIIDLNKNIKDFSFSNSKITSHKLHKTTEQICH